MNPSPETQHPTALDSSGPRPADTSLPHNWREALMALIASRVALIRLEAGQSAKSGASRAIRMAAAAFCLLFAWMLLLAGGIAALSACTGWAWHWVALATAALHLVLAWILIISCKGAPPAFPATRAEFQKDREWIQNFQQKPKSSN
jgi:threonine/homoserine/homoserine lactone efflux protein